MVVASLLLPASLSSLCASPDHQHVAVAGREVLKILRVPSSPSAPSEVSFPFTFTLYSSLSLSSLLQLILFLSFLRLSFSLIQLIFSLLQLILFLSFLQLILSYSTNSLSLFSSNEFS